jgi:hypothetical protein
MWRVIVRISYFHDTRSGLRNRVVTFFNSLGLHNTATGTFEGPAVSAAHVANQLSQVLHAVSNPQQFKDVDGKAALKHLWVYIDQAQISGGS